MQIRDLRDADPEMKAWLVEALGKEADELRLEALRLLERAEEAESVRNMALLLGAMVSVVGRIGARELMRGLAVRRGNPFIENGG